MPREARPLTAPNPIDVDALQQSELLFRALVQNTTDVIQLVGRDALIKYINPSVQAVLGYSPEELIGTPVPHLLHPEELAAMQASFYQLTEQPGAVIHVEQRVRHKDGSWRWVEVTATNLLGDLAVQAVVVTYHNITERKQMEDALRQEQYLIRSLLDNVPDAIYFKDADSRFIRVNPALARKHGLNDPEDLLGKTDFDFFTRDSAQAYYDQEQAIMRTGQPMVGIEEIEQWSERPTTWASTTKMALRDSQGQIVGTFGLTRDITQSKEAEAALRRSERNLAAAQALAHLGSWELDLTDLNNVNANRLRWSDEVYRIFGYQPGEIEATNDVFFDAVPPEDRPTLVTARDEAIQGHKQYSLDHRIIRPDGSERFVHEQSGVIYDEVTGQARMMAGIVQDITERQQAEAALAAKTEEVRAMTQQLWETAKLATMGELAAGIAHELNNPLATIHLRVEALLAALPDQSAQRRPLEIVEQEAERMARLIANLLHFSRRGSRQVSSLNVCEEIQNTLELLHYHLHQRQIKVVDDCGPNLPMIHFDRQQLRQVLVNLLTNASDAIAEGGQITLRSRQNSHRLQIEVIDTGTGIDPGQIPLVTEPFFTTKPEGKGTGLGLAICKRIMQEHGGLLEIFSEGIPGRGTRVQLSMPIPETATEPATIE